MNQLNYDRVPWTVRPEITAAHKAQWARLGSPGTWLIGAERVAVAAETRHAAGCALCAAQKATLSPYAITGDHDTLGDLSGTIVEQIHRIVSDPARLTKRWYDETTGTGHTPEAYVEIVGCIATTITIDTFCRGLGIPAWPLPEPQLGAPTKQKTPAEVSIGWVPTLTPELVAGTEFEWFYGSRKRVTNIFQAMGCVPEEVRGFFGDLVAAHYIPSQWTGDPDDLPHAITLPQIEGVATRVSSLNGCFY